MYFGSSKVIQGGNEYSWILLEFSARFIREKKESMHFGSLIMRFESLMDITRKVPSLGSLIAFIGINNQFGGEEPYLMDL